MPRGTLKKAALGTLAAAVIGIAITALRFPTPSRRRDTASLNVAAGLEGPIRDDVRTEKTMESTVTLEWETATSPDAQKMTGATEEFLGRSKTPQGLSSMKVAADHSATPVANNDVAADPTSPAPSIAAKYDHTDTSLAEPTSSTERSNTIEITNSPQAEPNSIEHSMPKITQSPPAEPNRIEYNMKKVTNSPQAETNSNEHNITEITNSSQVEPTSTKSIMAEMADSSTVLNKSNDAELPSLALAQSDSNTAVDSSFPSSNRGADSHHEANSEGRSKFNIVSGGGGDYFDYWELPHMVVTPDVNVPEADEMFGTLKDCMKACNENFLCWGFYRWQKNASALADCTQKKFGISNDQTNVVCLSDYPGGAGYYKVREEVARPDNNQWHDGIYRPLWDGITIVEQPDSMTTAWSQPTRHYMSPDLQVSEAALKIPPILHYISLEQHIAPWVASFQAAMPNWTIYIWHSEDVKRLRLVNHECHQQIGEKYNSAILEILGTYGGVAIWPEVSWVGSGARHLQQLIDKTTFFAIESDVEDADVIDFNYWAPGSKHLLHNSVVGSIAGHAILTKMSGLLPGRCGESGAATGRYLLSYAYHLNQQEHLDSGMDVSSHYASRLSNKTLCSIFWISKFCQTEAPQVSTNLGGNHHAAVLPGKIPHILHLIWLGPSAPPPFMQFWLQDFAQKFPSWTVRVWHDRNIGNLDIAMCRCFHNSADFREKSDMLRLEILARFGGIYLDADSIFMGKSLDGLIALADSTGFFSSFEPMKGPAQLRGFDNQNELDLFRTWAKGAEAVMQNGFIGSSVGHPLIRKALQMVDDRCGKDQPWVTTGPYLLSAALATFQPAYPLSSIATIVAHNLLYVNFWHIEEGLKHVQAKTLDELYDIVLGCNRHHGITFQVGLGTNERNSDFS